MTTTTKSSTSTSKAQVQSDLGPEDDHWELGKPYFVRTVTHHFTGRLVKVTRAEIVLTDVAWVADDGRFSVALDKGEVQEAEPYPDGKNVIIGRSSLIDASTWLHKLIRKVVPSK